MTKKRDAKGQLRDYVKEYAYARSTKRLRERHKARLRNRRAYVKKNGKIPEGYEVHESNFEPRSGKSRLVKKSYNRRKQPPTKRRLARLRGR